MAQRKKAAVAFENAKALFDKFVKSDKQFVAGRDIKLYNRIIKEKPFEFWMEIDLGFKLNSLAFFLTEDGKSKIKELEQRSVKEKKIAKNRSGLVFVPQRKQEAPQQEAPKKEEPRPIVKKDKRNKLIDFLGET